MKHCDTYDECVFDENNTGFDFVRLSIIDLSPAGHQPKLSQDERYVIVFYGEIYNYIYNKGQFGDETEFINE